MASNTHYRIKEGDSLEALAQRFLNNPSQWPSLVAPNNLRPPFISDDPLEQAGQALASGRLDTALPAGSLEITLNLPSPQLIVTDSQMAFRGSTNTGQIVWELVRISKPGELIGHDTRITFATGTVNTYAANAEWRVLPNPAVIITRVLRTGDMLVIPTTTILPVDQLDAQTTDEYNALLGRDVFLPHGTRKLAWDSISHDFAVVAGIDNLKQAIRLRLEIEIESLTYHPTYGNRVQQFVGHTNTAVFSTLCAGLLRECLTQETRIYSVENIVTQVIGDAIFADVTVRMRGLDTLVTVESLGIPFPR